MEKIKEVWFADGRIFVRTDQGRVHSRPLEAFPRLKRATEPNNEVAMLFMRFPGLKVQDVAQHMGVDESLLEKYLYGIRKPSPKRMEQLRSALRVPEKAM